MHHAVNPCWAGACWQPSTAWGATSGTSNQRVEHHQSSLWHRSDLNCTLPALPATKTTSSTSSTSPEQPSQWLTLKLILAMPASSGESSSEESRSKWISYWCCPTWLKVCKTQCAESCQHRTAAPFHQVCNHCSTAPGSRAHRRQASGAMPRCNHVGRLPEGPQGRPGLGPQNFNRTVML